MLDFSHLFSLFSASTSTPVCRDFSEPALACVLAGTMAAAAALATSPNTCVLSQFVGGDSKKWHTIAPCCSSILPSRVAIATAVLQSRGVVSKGRWVEERVKSSSGSRGWSDRRLERGAAPRAEVYIEEVEVGKMGIPDTQTAWIYKEYGPKEVLSVAEVRVQKPNTDQVLVKVHAAALNPVDYKRRLGKFKESDSDLPAVPGYDVAGVVVQVGSEVTKFKVGDRVYGDVSEHALKGPKQYGSLAQYCAVEEKLIAVIPQRLSFAEAASLPLAVETAYEGFVRANLKEGQTVLVLGGAGGVGSLAIQLAKHVFKASLVAATASTPKLDFVKSLGADVVIDYKKESLSEHESRYDVVYDTVGKGEGVIAVKENGSVVVLTGPVEPPAFRFVLTSTGDFLEKLNPFFEDGTLKPIIDTKGLFKFSELLDAFEYLETGRATGKVVISPIE